MRLLYKSKCDSYTEMPKVNQAGIRWKEDVLNWGGLMDVWRMFFEARSKACHKKSAEVIVPDDLSALVGEGLNH